MTEPGAKADHRSVRRHNLRLVLHEISRAPGSKADLAVRTGLTKATVGTLVRPLLTGNVLCESPHAVRTGPGRPSRVLSFAPTGPVAVGLDIDVEYLFARVTDLNGFELAAVRVPADNRGCAAAVLARRAARLFHQVTAALPGPVIGVAVAVAATVGADGVVLRAPNLPALAGTDLGRALRRALRLSADVPLWVDNEANLAAVHFLRSTPKPTTDFVYVSAGVGIGAGLVLGGTVFRGAHGFAGEFGHVVIDRDGPPCGCGGRGCIEQYAGQDALLRAAGLHTPAELSAALQADRAPARRAIRDAGTALGVALASMLNVIDVPCVVLGGTFAAFFDSLVEPVHAELARRALPPATDNGEIVRSPLGGDAAVCGATQEVTERVLRAPHRYLS